MSKGRGKIRQREGKATNRKTDGLSMLEFMRRRRRQE